MVTRIVDPLRVRQGWDSALCGPLAIVFELVRRRPGRYRQILTSLWSTGECMEWGYRLSVGDSPDGVARRPLEPGDPYVPPRTVESPGPTPAVDIIFAAALRNTENLILEAADEPDLVIDWEEAAASLTCWIAMERWTRTFLAFDRTTYHSCFVYGELDVLSAASDTVSAGGPAFLLCDSQYIDGMGGRDWWDPGAPNHWVTLLEPVTVLGNGDRQIVFQSWGTIHTNHMSEDRLEEFLWGAVVGSEPRPGFPTRPLPAVEPLPAT